MVMGLLRRKSNPALAADPWNLDLPMLALSRHKQDVLTLRDCLEGFLVMGALGSGKSSGSMRTLTKTMLSAGFGGLIIASSPEDRKDIIQYCEDTNRSSDLLIFSVDQPYRYNLLGAELARHGEGFIQNVVEILSIISEATDGYRKQGGDQAFWMTTMKEMVGYVATALSLSVQTLSLVDIRRMISSLPKNPAEANDREWQKQSFCYLNLVNALTQELSASAQVDLEFASDYLLGDVASMGSDTRGSVVLTFSAMASNLLSGSLRELFSMPTSGKEIDPVAFTNAGGVILVDMPVEKYNQVGRFAGVILKTAWQRGMMAREFIPGETRPNFLVIDEFQHLMTTYDMQFLQASRRHGVSCLYATQHLNNLLAGMGSEGRATVDAVCGLLSTRIFHSQSDVLTNTWASQCIGSDEFIQPTYSVNLGGANPNQPGAQAGGNTSERALVRPIDFTTLRRGGSHLETESILFRAGTRWKLTGRNFIPVIWRQDF